MFAVRLLARARAARAQAQRCGGQESNQRPKAYEPSGHRPPRRLLRRRHAALNSTSSPPPHQTLENSFGNLGWKNRPPEKSGRYWKTEVSRKFAIEHRTPSMSSLGRFGAVRTRGTSAANSMTHRSSSFTFLRTPLLEDVFRFRERKKDGGCRGSGSAESRRKR